MLDAQFVHCLLFRPFASLTVDLSDINTEPLSQSAAAVLMLADHPPDSAHDATCDSV